MSGAVSPVNPGGPQGMGGSGYSQPGVGSARPGSPGSYLGRPGSPRGMGYASPGAPNMGRGERRNAKHWQSRGASPTVTGRNGMGGLGGAAGRAQARAAARQQGYGGGAQGYGGGGMQGAMQGGMPGGMQGGMPATDGQLTARVNFLEQSNQQRDANISEVMARDDAARREASEARAREETLRRQFTDFEARLQQEMMDLGRQVGDQDTQAEIERIDANQEDLTRRIEFLEETVGAEMPEGGPRPGPYMPRRGPGPRGARPGRAFSAPPYGMDPDFEDYPPGVAPLGERPGRGRSAPPYRRGR